jgi:hypothetical protein
MNGLILHFSGKYEVLFSLSATKLGGALLCQTGAWYVFFFTLIADQARPPQISFHIIKQHTDL